MKMTSGNLRYHKITHYSMINQHFYIVEGMMRYGITATIQRVLHLLKSLSSILLLSSTILSQEPEDSLALDLESIWDNVEWVEITEIGEEYIGEVENITATAGVRGKESEDEILNYLYYRKSMKVPR